MNCLVWILVIVLSFPSFLYAVGNPKTTVIEGVISAAPQREIVIHNQPIKLDKKGAFRCPLRLKEPAYVKLNLGKTLLLYLEPGKILKVSCGWEDPLESARFEGSTAEINRYLQVDSRESEAVGVEFNKQFTTTVSLGESAYVEKINTMHQPFQKRLLAFRQKHKRTITPRFIRIQQVGIDYSRAGLLLRYPNWHRQVTADKNFQPTERYYDFLKPLDFNNPELLSLDEYKKFLTVYLDLKAGEELKNRPELAQKGYRNARAKIAVSLKTFTNPTVRDEMIFEVMKPLVTDYNTKAIDDLLDLFRKNCTNRDYLFQIEKLYDQDKLIQSQCRIQIYKTVDGISLDAFIYLPEDWKPIDKRAAVAFFHGGGWECGKAEWGHSQCRHFTQLGLVGVSFEYRLVTQHNATPLESVRDVKSALRWMRRHAAELGIAPQRIAASGFSAGSHLAASTTLLEKFDEPGENTDIGSAANALILWSPPVYIEADGWFKQILADKAPIDELNPNAHIRPALPPTILFQGVDDRIVPAWGTKIFADKMKEAGNRCELHLYERQGHFFDEANRQDVMKNMDQFLESIGYLQPKK
jgi:acetyl esterase/lipase